MCQPGPYQVRNIYLIATQLDSDIRPDQSPAMGNILTAITQIRDSEDPVSGAEVGEKFGIFLDFESDAILPEPDNQLHSQLEVALREAEENLNIFSSYGLGGKQAIFEATSNRNPENQEKTWATLVPLMGILSKSKSTTDNLNKFVPEILGQIWTDAKGNEKRKSIVDILKMNMYLMIQLGKILDINMRFDAKKIQLESISNDISYVKRQFSLRQRVKTSGEMVPPEYEDIITIENLQNLSSFYISSNPGLSNNIATMTAYFNKCANKDEPLELLASFCKICIKILTSEMRRNFQKFGTIGMVQRIMVATVLLYDHLSLAGVFVKDSPISVKAVVEILKEEAGIQPKKSLSKTKSTTSNTIEVRPVNTNRVSYQELTIQAKNLITFLKYSNKHLRDSSTPKQINNLFNSVA